MTTVVHWLVRHQHFVIEKKGEMQTATDWLLKHKNLVHVFFSMDFYFPIRDINREADRVQSPSEAAHKKRKDKSVNDSPLLAGEQ